MRSVRLLGVLALAGILFAAPAALSGPTSPTAQAGTTVRDAVAPSATMAMTLVTGEVVRTGSLDGRDTVELAGADGVPGAAHATFIDPDGHQQIWPTAAIPAIGTLLDADLFDVTALLDAGYADASGRALRLVVEHDGAVALPSILHAAGALSATELRVTVAVADRAAFGSLVRRAAAGERTLPGVTYIRLDDGTAAAGGEQAEHDGEHTITLELAPHEAGGDFTGLVQIQPIGVYDRGQTVPVDQTRATVSVTVAEGTYHLVFDSQQSVSGEPALVDVSAHDVVVDGDITVRLDGASADEISVETDSPARRPDALIGGSVAPFPGSGVYDYGLQVNGADNVRLLVAPTDPPIGGEHIFSTLQTLLTDDASYHLGYDEPDGVPAGLTYIPDPAELTEVHNATHADVTGRDYLIRAVGYRGISGVQLEGSVFPVPAGATHTTFVSWLEYGFPSWQLAIFAGDHEGSAGLLADRTGWERGGVTEQAWFAPVVRPAAPADDPLAQQFNDSMSFSVASFLDAASNVSFHWYDPDVELDHVSYEVWVGGTVAASGDGDLYDVNVPIPATSTDIDVTLDTTRDASWWLSSTHTHTEWHFASLPLEEDISQFPAMLTIDYDIATDLTNRAAPPATIGFHAYQPGENPLGIPIAAFSAWTSIDGTTWQELTVEGTGDGTYEAELPLDPACADPCRVSLRALAEDVDGNSIEQTVTDAFVLGASTPPTTTPPTTTPPTTTPPTTTPPTGSPTVTPTTTPTLPPTGSSSGGTLRLGLLSLLAGGLLLLVAHRRVRTQRA